MILEGLIKSSFGTPGRLANKIWKLAQAEDCQKALDDELKKYTRKSYFDNAVNEAKLAFRFYRSGEEYVFGGSFKQP